MGAYHEESRRLFIPGIHIHHHQVQRWPRDVQAQSEEGREVRAEGQGDYETQPWSVGRPDDKRAQRLPEGMVELLCPRTLQELACAEGAMDKAARATILVETVEESGSEEETGL